MHNFQDTFLPTIHFCFIFFLKMYRKWTTKTTQLCTQMDAPPSLVTGDTPSLSLVMFSISGQRLWGHALTGQHLSTVFSLHFVSILEVISVMIKKIVFIIHSSEHDLDPSFAKKISHNMSTDGNNHRPFVFTQKKAFSTQCVSPSPLTKSPFI